MLDAGKLRHRLVILELDQEQDAITGEMEETWETLATVWGAFEPYSTREFIAAASLQVQTVARAIIRYRSDVKASMRVLFREQLYEINGRPLPDKESGREYLTLMLADIYSYGSDDSGSVGGYLLSHDDEIITGHDGGGILLH